MQLKYSAWLDYPKLSGLPNPDHHNTARVPIFWFKKRSFVVFNWGIQHGSVIQSCLGVRNLAHHNTARVPFFWLKVLQTPKTILKPKEKCWSLGQSVWTRSETESIIRWRLYDEGFHFDRIPFSVNSMTYVSAVKAVTVNLEAATTAFRFPYAHRYRTGILRRGLQDATKVARILLVRQREFEFTW